MSTPFRLYLPRRLFEEMVSHARADFPNECCGLLGGIRNRQEGRVLRRYPLVNAAASPVRFESEPQSMFAAVRAMRQERIDILAVYHSHPRSEPVPSRSDLERNYSSDVATFIIALKNTVPEMRGWWLTTESYHEAEWELTEEEPPHT